QLLRRHDALRGHGLIRLESARVQHHRWGSGAARRGIPENRPRVTGGFLMDGVAVLRSAFAGAHGWSLGTVADVGAEQANTGRPGIAPPIGALIAHILHTEDFMFNTAVRDQATLWERDGWGAKLGGEMLLAQE